MKIEMKNKKYEKSIEDLSSGTIIEYGNEYGDSYGLAIVIKDCDNDNCLIYDLVDGCYYSDVYSYKALTVYDTNNVKLVIE